MKRARHIAASLALAALLLPPVCWSAEGRCSEDASKTLSADGRDKKKKKENESPAPQGNVTKIRITMDLAELRDSIEAAWNRDQDELLEDLTRDTELERQAISAQIDDITGLGHGRPRSYKGDMLVSLAKEHLGKPYRWASNGPDMFDCSGFTRYVYKEIGVYLPRHSGDQFRAGRRIDVLTDLQEGDLVFFGKKNSIRTVGHVGIVVSVDREHGKFTFIHASSSGGVRISPNNDPYFYMRFMGGARFIGDGE